MRMRRIMLDMSQSKLADSIGLTFQQVQKYENGTNRMGASRLQHIAHVLQVSVPFFFEDAPGLRAHRLEVTELPSVEYISEFLSTTDGAALTKAFMKINDAKLRRRIVNLVEQIAVDHHN